jgi:hypothetical protein
MFWRHSEVQVGTVLPAADAASGTKSLCAQNRILGRARD